VRVLKKGWAEIPLGLAGVALEKAELDGKAAQLKPVAGGYALVARGPAKHHLRVRFSVPATRDGCSFTLQPVASAVAVIETPITTHDLLIPSSLGGQRDESTKDLRRIVATVGAARRLEMRWSAKKIAGTGEEAHVKAETATLYSLYEGFLLTAAKVQFSFSHGERDRFRLALEKPLHIKTVSGGNLRTWRVTDKGKTQVLEVILHSPVKGSYTLTVGAEAPLLDPFRETRLPHVSCPGVSREHGVVAVALDPILRYRVKRRTGLVQVEPDGTAIIPAGKERAVLRAAYRFSRRPVELVLAPELLPEKVRGDLRTLLAVSEKQLSVEVTVELLSRGRPVYDFRLAFPAALEVKEVLSPLIQDWWVESKGKRKHLIATFRKGLTGTASIRFRFERKLAKEERELAIPAFALPGLKRQKGTIAVLSGEGLEITARDLDHLVSLDLKYLRWLRSRPGFLPRQAFRYAGEEYAGKLEIRPLTHYISVTSVMAALIKADIVEFSAQLNFRVENRGTEKLVFLLPAWIGSEIELDSEGLREIASEEVTLDGKRYRRWTVSFQSAVLGERGVRVFFEKVIGKEGLVEIPELRIPGAREERIYVLVRKAPWTNMRIEEAEVLEADAVSHEEIPFYPPGTRPRDFLFTYAVRKGWAIRIKQTVLEEEKGIEALVAEAHLVSVLDEEGSIRATATYRIQNRTEQFLEVKLPAGVELWSVFVGKKPVKPAVKETPDGLIIMIPLPKKARGELSFQAEIAYSAELPGGFGAIRTLRPPVPEVKNIKVSETFWTLYLPDRYRFFDFEGNMEEVPEAIRETVSLQKQILELERIADVAKTGKESEKRAALDNIPVQIARIQDQLDKANRAQDIDQQQAEVQGREQYIQMLAHNDANLKKLQSRNNELLNRLRRQNLYRGRRPARIIEREGKPAYRHEASKAMKLRQAFRLSQLKSWSLEGKAQKKEKYDRTTLEGRFERDKDRKVRDALRGVRLGIEGKRPEPKKPGRPKPAAGRPVWEKPAGPAPAPRPGVAGEELPAEEAPAEEPPEDTGITRDEATVLPVSAARREKGTYSMRVDIPRTGVANHFRKPEGKPEIRFRAASVRWAERGLRLLRALLLAGFVVLFFRHGLFQIDRGFARIAFFSVLLAGLAVLASLNPFFTGAGILAILLDLFLTKRAAAR
jgi:hypothetical protein